MYTLKYAPEVRTYYAGLSPRSKAAVKNLLALIAQAPYYGIPVRSMPGVRYQKSLDCPRDEFPAGIRVLYTVLEEIVTVAVIDLGDHDSSAQHPGQSVYADERLKAA